LRKNWEIKSLFIIIFYGLWFLLPELLLSEPEIELKCFPGNSRKCSFAQGEVCLLLLSSNQALKSVSGELWDKPVVFWGLEPEGKLWNAFIGSNLKQRTGKYWIKIKMIDENEQVFDWKSPVWVQTKTYPVQRLTMPKERVEFPPGVLEQVLKDNQTITESTSPINPTCYWQGKFEKPILGELTSPFGAKRIINDIPKSPNYGIDLAAELGELVRATNNGKVVLAYDGYLIGKSLVIDHGGGLYSFYCHLSEFLVAPGQMVSKGEGIGLAGATGSATGPHLHFGIKLNQNWVDPVLLMELSQMLEQITGQAQQGQTKKETP